MGHATAFPDRRADGAVTRAARALLLPRLLAAAAYLAATLGVGRYRAGVVLHRGNDLVHERIVPGNAKDVFREFDGACLLALCVVYVCFHKMISRGSPRACRACPG